MIKYNYKRLYVIKQKKVSKLLHIYANIKNKIHKLIK